MHAKAWKNIYHLRMSFSSETWIQVYKANAKDGFVINEIIFFSLREIICFCEYMKYYRTFDQRFEFKVFLL